MREKKTQEELEEYLEKLAYLILLYIINLKKKKNESKRKD